MQTDFSYEREVFRNQRTRRGVRWERTITAFKELMNNPDSEAEGDLRESNEGLVQLRDLGPDAVHIDAVLKDFSIRYVNDEYIGDRLMPVATTGHRSNVYFKYDERAQLAFPDDKLGPRGQANEVRQSVTTDNYVCRDYGLEEFVDLTEMANADQPLDPLADAGMLVNEGIAFNREKRIRDVLTTAGNYGANTVAIGAGSEWNSATGGNPIKIIQKAVDSIYNGPGNTKLVGFTSVNVFRTLSRHSAIRDLFKYQRDGFATAQQLAAYFGLDDLLVGKARRDTANEGQTESITRIWPDVFGIVRVALVPSPRTYCFGTTFRSSPVQTIQLFDRRHGVNGGYIVRVTLSEDHKVVASRAGYLITNCFDSNLA
jgi:hypothetical protein